MKDSLVFATKTAIIAFVALSLGCSIEAAFFGSIIVAYLSDIDGRHQ